jgi:hypothetical protein
VQWNEADRFHGEDGKLVADFGQVLYEAKTGWYR